MLSPFAFELAAFLLGLLFGSFLNVIISRLPRGESVVRPRSHCPHCNTPIRPYDNIPLLSWILLRGRCRTCQQPIPWRYPLVELGSALWLGQCARLLWEATHLDASVAAVGLSSQTESQRVIYVLVVLGVALLGLLLLALIVIDWQHQLLPNALTLGGIFASFLLTCTEAIFIDPKQAEVHLRGRNPFTSPGATIDRGNLIFTGPEAFLGRWLLSVLAAAAVLLVIRALYKLLRDREGMGLGDVKLLALIAAFLGFWSAILALFVGVLLATAYALTLLARRRAHALTRLPFGSFLGVGGLISALFGQQLIGWYTSLLR